MKSPPRWEQLLHDENVGCPQSRRQSRHDRDWTAPSGNSGSHGTTQNQSWHTDQSIMTRPALLTLATMQATRHVQTFNLAFVSLSRKPKVSISPSETDLEPLCLSCPGWPCLLVKAPFLPFTTPYLFESHPGVCGWACSPGTWAGTFCPKTEVTVDCFILSLDLVLNA